MGLPTRTRTRKRAMTTMKRSAPTRPKVQKKSKKSKSRSKSSSKAASKTANTESFGYCVSLGSLCFTARFLELKGLRTFKSPFDWIYSSAYMVRHILANNFKSWLNRNLYVKQKKNSGTSHSLYVKMLLSSGRGIIWPHHDLLTTKNGQLASEERAVERFRNILKSKISQKKLFVLCQTIKDEEALEASRQQGPQRLLASPATSTPKEGGPELGSLQEIRHLFQDLTNKVEGCFHLDVVNLVLPPVSRAGRSPTTSKIFEDVAGRQSKGSLTVHEMHCKGANTGLFFKEKEDKVALHKLIIAGRSFSLIKIDDSQPKGMTDVASAASQSSRSRRSENSRKKRGSEATSPRSGGVIAAARKARGGDSRRIRVQKENPKLQGSKGWQRYEKYKKATTVKEFFQLGGCPGDLQFDSLRGWIEFR
eukprot:TRINITY_DN12296_c0_g1_i1.p1 TRINITY_DN12296_c0_g1~~TRINITY_DN12296_c0_g1_i1.p1  ORF type:complete len:421 (+),score=52.19 TRINITY_DN12296_c0_g1_i1:53-1315(+)